MDARRILFLIVCGEISSIGAKADDIGCTSPQYLKIGTNGVINCSFNNGFYSLLWYSSADIFHSEAILTMVDSVRSGTGFLSGEFDVDPNGSLIIHNVTLKSEGTFTAIVLETLTSDVIRYVVDVVIVAPTLSRLPLILECENSSEMCFQILTPHTEVSCTIQDARPAVSLSWKVRTNNGDRNVSSSFSIRNSTHHFFTSLVTTAELFTYSSYLTLLVCKADSPPGLLEKNESFILLQNGDEEFTSVASVTKYVETGTMLELNCTDNTFLYLTWQVKKPSETVFSNILFAVFVGGNFQPHIYDHNYSLNRAGSLVISAVSIQNEGIYRCVSGNGIEDDVLIYNVVVFVLPYPAHLVVDGCHDQQNCVLEMEPEGSLTCAVRGIRPQVEVDFIVSHEQSSEALFLYDKHLITKENGDVYDISLTSKFRRNDASKTRVTIECKLIGTDITLLDFSTKVEILFLGSTKTSTEEGVHENNERSTDRGYLWFILPGIAFLLGIYATSRRVRRITCTERCKILPATNYLSNAEEDIPMMTQDEQQDHRCLFEQATVAKKESFKSELRARYNDLFCAVRPIPFNRNQWYCVEKVFVEGGIEYLVPGEEIDRKETWKQLDSYQSILCDPRVKSRRRILEGAPGHGKSTLTLQLAHDWCNQTLSPHVSNTDIFILLPLRELDGVKSIYKAIKQFLLREGTVFTENIIKIILRNSPSVLLVLDGFDEYIYQERDESSDIMSIIAYEMFQNVDVILTTRSSYLPKEYPAFTKRLKLTGFNDTARDQYILKSVVGGDTVAAKKVKERLRYNPVLRDICQVPLLFVMFAHLSHERINLQILNSVTSYFRYMISCFHGHMKNKMTRENLRNYILFETEHNALNKLALEGLGRKVQQIVWSKEYMCDNLGEEFYDRYVQIGILVEENILDMTDDCHAKMNENVKYSTNVRFCHKLLCEWYAAHYLSENASRGDVTLYLCNELELREGSELSEGYYSNEGSMNDVTSINYIKNIADKEDYLQNFEPYQFQYLYRCVCGLNPEAAKRIIGYLKSMNYADSFITLCILEQNGKINDGMQKIEDFCAQNITVHKDYSLLLQRSSVELLEIASDNKIAISSVNLRECFEGVVKHDDIFLQFKSSLYMPILTTLKNLIIEEKGRELTTDEIADVLQYSSNSAGLETLCFWECLLPQFIHTEVFTTVRSRNFEVKWYPYISSILPPVFELDLKTGLWKHGDIVITDEEYKRVAREVRSFRQ